MAKLLANVVQRFYDANGAPLVGGKLYSYIAGSSTPQATYTDQTEGTPNANPTILDANGAASIWMGAGKSYKFTLTDASDVSQWTVDNVDDITRTVDLADLAVTTGKIADKAVTAAKIGDATITDAQIADGAVGTDEIADDAVTTAKLLDSNVTVAKLDPAIDFTGLENMVEVVVTNPGDFLRGGVIKVVPQFPWSATPAKISDPVTTPTSTGESCSWSPCGEFLAVAHTTSPYITIYQRNGTVLNKLADPLTLPTGNAFGASWSADGMYLAVAHTTSPYLTVYRKSGVTFTKMLDPAILPPGQGNAVSWSPNGRWIALASSSTSGSFTYICVYEISSTALISTLSKTATGTVIDVANVSTSGGNTYADSVINTMIGHINQAFKELQYVQSNNLTYQLIAATGQPAANYPAGASYGCAWSPSHDFLAVAHATTPYVTIYQRSGVALTKVSDPGTLPAGTAGAVAWSPDGQFLVVGHSSSPYITIYQRSGTTFTKIANPSTLPTISILKPGLKFSPNGQYLAVATDTSPYVWIYSISGTTFTKLADPSTLPAGVGNGVSWSPDGQFLAVAHATSPYVTVYQTDQTLPAKAVLWAREIINV